MKKLSQDDIMSMRNDFFDKVKSPEMRQRILTIAFAYGSESDDENATDMMAWFLAQPENKDRIDELAEEFLGNSPENLES